MTREEQKKRIYYVQVSNVFFEDKGVRQVLATSIGDTVFRVYMQLWCVSLTTDGVLPLDGDVPTAEELAIALDLLPLKKLAPDRWQAELKVINSAVEILAQYKLIEITDDGIEFPMTERFTRSWSADTINRQDKGDEAADKHREQIKAFMDAWQQTDFPQVRKLTDKRRKALLQRIADYGIDDCIKAVKIASKTPFCLGQNNRGWRADFDFFVKPDSITKILEGKYGRTKAQGTGTTQTTTQAQKLTEKEIYGMLEDDGVTYCGEFNLQRWDAKKSKYPDAVKKFVEKKIEDEKLRH